MNQCMDHVVMSVETQRAHGRPSKNGRVDSVDSPFVPVVESSHSSQKERESRSEEEKHVADGTACGDVHYICRKAVPYGSW